MKNALRPVTAVSVHADEGLGKPRIVLQTFVLQAREFFIEGSVGAELLEKLLTQFPCAVLAAGEEIQRRTADDGPVGRRRGILARAAQGHANGAGRGPYLTQACSLASAPAP